MSDKKTTVAVVRDAIIAELSKQSEKVYFWDEADKELMAGGAPEWSEFLVSTVSTETYLMADRFDMDAVARAAIAAMGQSA